MVSQLRGDEPALTIGDSGEGVVELQVRLYRLGLYRQLPDATYDLATEDAVRELQAQTGHSATGEVDRSTWEAIVYWEQQHGLDYQFLSPYDALAQLQHDLQQPQEASGQFPGTDPAGQLSADGQWRWDGQQWHPVAGDDAAGQLSADGQWRWDGREWVAAGGDGYVGVLSEDGYWRWTGTEWVPA
jgi:peptidoglycan hydrolase-like protein with peptidoglycan-binding domain